MKSPDPAKECSWTVFYPDEDRLSATFRGLRFHQSGEMRIGTAEHEFSVPNSVRDAAEVFRSMVTLAERGDFTFRIADSAESQTQTYKHAVVAYDPVYDRQHGFKLVVHTADMRASKLNVDDKTRIHLIEVPLTDYAEEILAENGMKKDGEAWESSGVIEEHVTLAQANLTDWQWLAYHLNPRVGPGYRLYAQSDESVRYHSFAITGPSLVVDPAYLLDVREPNRSHEAMQLGGGSLRVTGYDPMLKIPVEYTSGPDHTPSYGIGYRLYKGERRQFFPLISDIGVKAWAEARNARYAFGRYGLVVRLRGHIPDTGWIMPFEVDLSRTDYRSKTAQRAAVVSVYHEIVAGKYSVTLNGTRSEYGG